MKTIFLFLFLTNFSDAAEVILTKAQFVEGIKKSLPDDFCLEKKYFRKCFQISEADCKKFMTAASTDCFTALEKGIPAKLNEDAGGKWGEKIGTCVGDKYEGALAKLKADIKTAPDCNDASKWK